MAAPRSEAHPFFEVSMRPDGIAMLQWTVPTLVTLELADASLLALNRVSGGVPVPVLVDIGQSNGMDREGRVRFQQATNHLATALVVRSPVSRLIANFFIRLNKPVFPIQLFNSEAEAVAWLLGFLKAPS